MDGDRGLAQGQQGGKKRHTLERSGSNHGIDDKDKGKARDDEPSIVDRLHASGKLALDALSGINTDTMPTALPGRKTMASSSQTPTMLGEASSSASSQRTATRMGNSMRASTYTGNSSEAFDSFMKGPPDHDDQFAVQLQSQTLQGPNKSVAEQEASDGAAVVQLLLLPDDAADYMPQGNDDDGLSPSEAVRLREALFGSGNASSRAIAWDRLLNFNPEFITLPDAMSSFDAQLYTGTTNVSESQSIWLQQWSDVLSAYTDEVWGDLASLASEARREIDQMEGEEPAGLGPESSETRALGRLRLILAHVRGH